MLHRTITSDVGIEGPLSENQQASRRAPDGVLMSADGVLPVNSASVTDFIRGLGTWPHAIFDGLPPESRASVFKGVSQTCLALVSGVLRVVAEREADKSDCYRDLPPVLPHQLAKFSPVRFLELVSEQLKRQEACFSAVEIEELEQQHRKLRTASVNEPAFRRRIGIATDLLTFETAWSGLNNR